MDLKDTVDRLLEAGAEIQSTPTLITSKHGRDYYDASLVELTPPMAQPLEVKSLLSLVRLAEDLPYGAEKIAFHVIGPDRVELVSGLDDESMLRQRFGVAVSPHDSRELNGFLARKHTPERFVLGLLSFFAPSDTLGELVAVFGNLQSEVSRTSEDDGVSQIVTTKRGVRPTNAVVRNPVTLTPWRSFMPEVPGIGSPYVLRTHGGGDSEPEVSLTAAGNAWVSPQIDDIKELLSAQMLGVAVY